MIQFNLLPDVKQEYMKSRRLKRLVILASSIIATTAFVFFVFLLILVDVLQKQNINSISAKITTGSQQLTSSTNLNKILTVQNQLESLPALDNGKPVVSRLFTYISQVIPSQASISNTSVNFLTYQISISGSADTIATINTLVDTLKFATYSDSTGGAQKPAFSNVVLTSFSTSGTGPSGSAYSISFQFDPAIFDIQNNITLTVPSLVTTRSAIDHPAPLFQQTQTTTPGASAPNTSH